MQRLFEPGFVDGVFVAPLRQMEPEVRARREFDAADAAEERRDRLTLIPFLSIPEGAISVSKEMVERKKMNIR